MSGDRRWTIRHEPHSPLGAYIKGPATEEIEVAPTSEVEQLREGMLLLERTSVERFDRARKAEAEVERLRGALAEKHRQIVAASSHHDPKDRLRALDELTETDDDALSPDDPQ